MDIPTHRPTAIKVRLGPSLHASRDRAARDLARPAVQGLTTGIAVGFAVGTHVMPSSIAVFLIGALALSYALVSFLFERP